MQTRNTSRKIKKNLRVGNKVGLFQGTDRSPYESLADRDIDAPLIISTEPGPVSPSDYICTGDFATDFTHLCEMHGLYYVPPVVPRRTPESKFSQCAKTELTNKSSAASLVPGKKLHRKISRRFSAGSHSVADSTLDVEAETGISTPLFNIQLLSPAARERYQSLRPRVVEYKQFGKTVTEIYIDGWKVDDTMMSILCHCSQALEELTSLHLWNTGLTAPVCNTLTAALPHFHKLKTLILDGNDLSETNVYLLLEGNAGHLESLSLRFCRLNDRIAGGIGHCLGTDKTWNKRLVTLNLSNNKITDKGAQHIAEGLKTNRALLVLNLACNQIGDEGAFAFARVLSSFPLSKNQMIERKSKFQKVPKIRMGSTELKRTGSNIFKIPLLFEKSRRKRSSFKDDKGSHVAADGQRSGKESVAGRKKKEGKSPAPTLLDRLKAHKQFATVDQPSAKISRSEEENHPLLEVVIRQEGSRVWVLGNRSLLSLNLSRNVIGEKGLHHLWLMLQEQVIIWNNQHQTMPGLKRLVLDKNAVAANNKLLLKIQHYMMVRDPLAKIPLVTLHKGSVSPCAIPPIQI